MQETYTINRIKEEDDKEIFKIIRHNLEQYHLDIPGTAYFDPELDHLSTFYNQSPDTRAYFIVKDKSGKAVGGAGLAEFKEIENCCELQKLYLSDEVKGQGLSKKVMQVIEDTAKEKGYTKIYLETHTNLKEAIGLYEKLNYQEIERPVWVFHTTMNRFYIKTL